MTKKVKNQLGFIIYWQKCSHLFDSFGIEYIPQVLNRVKDNSITQNILRIQADDSFMCYFYCIACKLHRVTDYQKNSKVLRDEYGKKN